MLGNMVAELLEILKGRVDDHLRRSGGASADDAQEARVVYPSTDRLDVTDFKLNAVTILLANLEADHAVRPDDPWLRARPDGTTNRGQLPIVMNAYVLFVARFAAYEDGLRDISRIIQLFQAQRVLDHDNTPSLSEGIEKLVVELAALPFSEQNHLWSMLRTAYLPSLLYRVRMMVFQDDGTAVAPPVQKMIITPKTFSDPSSTTKAPADEER